MNHEINLPDAGNPLQNLAINVSKNFTDPVTTIDSKKRRITVAGKIDDALYSVFIEETDNGEIRRVSAYKDLQRKSDYKNDIKKLYKEGYKQKDIALMLGISQSLVSKLLKD